MDKMPEMELDRDQLISLVVQLREELKNAREELKAAHDRIAELEQQLRKQSPDTRLEDEYSLKAEEQRQNNQSGKRRKQKSARRGRRTTQEKLDEADRIQIVCPDGFDVEQCELHRQRPVWRIEEGRAVLGWRTTFIAARAANFPMCPGCCRAASSGWRSSSRWHSKS